jgi:hypothetical protein
MRHQVTIDGITREGSGPLWIDGRLVVGARTEDGSIVGFFVERLEAEHCYRSLEPVPAEMVRAVLQLMGMAM